MALDIGQKRIQAPAPESPRLKRDKNQPGRNSNIVIEIPRTSIIENPFENENEKNPLISSPNLKYGNYMTSPMRKKDKIVDDVSPEIHRRFQNRNFEPPQL